MPETKSVQAENAANTENTQTAESSEAAKDTQSCENSCGPATPQAVRLAEE